MGWRDMAGGSFFGHAPARSRPEPQCIDLHVQADDGSM